MRLVVIFLKFWGCTMLLIDMYAICGNGWGFCYPARSKKGVQKSISSFVVLLFVVFLPLCCFLLFLRLHGSLCAFIRKQSLCCCYCPLHLAAPLACFQPRCLLVQPCCLLFLPFCLFAVQPFCLFAVLPFCVAFGNVVRNIWLITWRTFHPTAGTLDSPACLLAIDKHALWGLGYAQVKPCVLRFPW